MLRTIRWAGVLLLVTGLACTVLSWLEQPADGPREDAVPPKRVVKVRRLACAPAPSGRAIRQTERAEKSVRSEEPPPEAEPRPASSAAGAGEELVDATYQLPQPPPGRVWIAAETLFDATTDRGPWRPTVSWPASDLSGRSAAVIEAMKHRVAPATWKSIAGAELRAHGKYTIFARTTRVVHAEIRRWLAGLHTTTVLTQPSVEHELAWMLSRGTPLEREWAHEALAWIPATSRDRVEDALAKVPPAGTETPTAGEVELTSEPRVRIACQLIRAEPSFFRDIGIDIRGNDCRYWFEPRSDECMSFLDDTQREVLERSLEQHVRAEKLGGGDTVSPSGTRLRLVLGEHAVLHLRMTVSKDRRFIDIQGRVHAQNESALFFAPPFQVSVPDEGTLLICVRDVITGARALKHTLSVLLQAACTDGQAHSQPTPDLDLPETDWVPVQPVREP